MAEYTWYIADDGSWNTPSRWQPTEFGIYPDGPSADALITAVGDPYTVEAFNYIIDVVNGSYSEIRVYEVGNLVVGAPATLAITSDGFIVREGLTVDGAITTASYTDLIIGQGTGTSDVLFSGTGTLTMLNGGKLIKPVNATVTLTLDGLQVVAEREANAQASEASEIKASHLVLTNDATLKSLNNAYVTVEAESVSSRGFIASTNAWMQINAATISNIGGGVLRADTGGELTLTGSIRNTGTISAEGNLPPGTSLYDVANLTITGDVDQRSDGTSTGALRADEFATITVSDGTIRGGFLQVDETTGMSGMTLFNVILDGSGDEHVTVMGGVKLFGASGARGTLEGGINTSDYLMVYGSTFEIESGGLTVASTLNMNLREGAVRAGAAGVTWTMNGMLSVEDGLSTIGTGDGQLSWVIGSSGRVYLSESLIADRSALTVHTGNTIVNNGLITVDTADLTVRDTVTGSGKVELFAGASARFVRDFDQLIDVRFGNSTVEQIAFSFDYDGGISGLGLGDTIDLLYAAPAGKTATFTGSSLNGLLTIKNADGSVFTDLFLKGDYRNYSFNLSADSSGGTLITLGTADPTTADFATQAEDLVVDLGAGIAYGPPGGTFGTRSFSGVINATTGSGNDVLQGTAGANILAGGAGTDLIFGLGGDDTLIGGAAQTGQYNQLFGGEGTDTASYAGTSAAVYADLRGGAGIVAGVLTDTFSSIENLRGGSGNDLLVGNEEANLFHGGGGTDQLFGFGGRDTFIGGTAAAGTQNQLWGGDGVDTADYSAQTADVYVELRAPAGYVGGQLTDLMNAVENAMGGSGNDTLVGADADANMLVGGAGTDLLFGFGGNDVLVGGSALSGQYNQLWGGDGLDAASYEGTSASVYADLNVFAGWVSNGSSLVLADVYNSVENLLGGAGADTLAGDGGSNAITGGLGADILYGRGGGDTFIYRSAGESSVAAGYDTIADFETGSDKLDLTALGLTLGQIQIASGGGSTSLYADVNAATPGFELAIAFVGTNAITTADLLI